MPPELAGPERPARLTWEVTAGRRARLAAATVAPASRAT